MEQSGEKDRGSSSTFFEDMFTRLCVDEQRSFATALDDLDEKSTALHHNLLDASRLAHERVYRAAEAERLRAEELERRERLERITRPPDPLPPPPPPPAPRPVQAPVQPPAPAPAPVPASGSASVGTSALSGATAPSQRFQPQPPRTPTVTFQPTSGDNEGSQQPVRVQEKPAQDATPQHVSFFNAQNHNQPRPSQEMKAPREDVPPSGPSHVPVNGIHGVSTAKKEGGADEADHQKYLGIHQRLKEMRKDVVSNCKRIPQLKTKVGDMRRDITTRIGQLSTDKSANKKAIERIQTTLQEARRIPEPQVDLAKFLIDPPSGVIPESGIFVYLLSILSKKIIAQLAEEAGRDTKRAEPVGTMAATIFSTDSLKLGPRPLVDILLAKYHVVCPVLFGIYGNEKTKFGRKRLGWLEQDKGSGKYISENEHNDRMTGLGAGYASLSLRDFSKSQRQNPYPAYHFWRALARILNTPPAEVTTTHVVILRGMLENYIPRFVRFYGHPAYVAVKKALIQFPTYAPPGPAVSSLQVLRDILKRDEHITIE
ncbi:MAG: hypothetical protein M1822_007832 [Bathelium mastoideum]|nr:MAG: hypothetical protein M1822_007832 [Bathelium mastoideum]